MMEAKKDIMKMGRIRKSVWVSYLIIMLVEGWFCECEGCWKQERDALLHLKAISGNVEERFNTWVDGTDCCQWGGVECNNTTRRVSELNLNVMWNQSGNWHLNASDFQVFDDIKSLDLSSNKIAGFVKNKGNESFLWPAKLEVLVLSGNSLSNDIISSLNGFQHLKSLDLNSNQLEGSVDISGLCALSKLKVLDLSYNYNISGLVFHQGTNICLGSVKVLRLEGLKIDGSMLRKSFRAFSSIRMLYMAYNTFNGIIVAGDFGDLENLEHLELDSSNIGNEFFKSIGALTSLKVLSLMSCGIKGTLPDASWAKLKKLEELDLSRNELEGPLPLSFANMTSLRRLDLSRNSFTGNFASNLATLTSLEYLDFSINQFQVLASFTFLANYSNLKFIDGSDNKVIPDPHPTFQTWVPKFQLQEFWLSSTTEANSLPLPNFLIHQYNLTDINFTGCKFQGKFPNWLLENNTKMETLSLRNCSFTGNFQLPSHLNSYLGIIDVSNNGITGQFLGNNISSIFPNLQYLDMSRNAINGSLPHEFGPQLGSLDLSYNRFSGEIPRNLSMVDSVLRILKLSHNKLEGSVYPTLATLSMQELHLDGNSFSGSIPSCFFNASLTIDVLDISNNHFVGKLPNGEGKFSNMVALSIANNHLEGSIPTNIIEQSSLNYLDLSRNNLSGSIPSFVYSSASYVLLNNNRLSGLATTMFNKSLIMLDLSNNNITGKIEDLIGSISQLNILLLRGNHFMGQIPNQMYQLTNLTMVDISYNSLSGPIPNCLGKIPFEVHVGSLYPIYGRINYGYELKRETKVDFTTKWRSYTYKGSILSYMSGMDLSHNKLNGSIPRELGNLLYIRAMNLSHNHLRGQIPATFSNLKQVESLDLSFNKLSGEIPHQLTELTFLEVFSLAHNNLSGTTPERKGQFLTFDGSSYEGNPFLCGPPLNKSCIDPSGILPNTSDVEVGNNDGIIDMEFFYISFVVSYTSILLVMAAILCINPQWRRAWFYFIEYVITNCYYYFHKWFTIQHM